MLNGIVDQLRERRMQDSLCGLGQRPELQNIGSHIVPDLMLFQSITLVGEVMWALGATVANVAPRSLDDQLAGFDPAPEVGVHSLALNRCPPMNPPAPQTSALFM